MKTILFGFATSALLFSGSLNAKTIYIEDEMCRYQMRIDESKHSERQFQDTMKMMWSYNALVSDDIDHRSSEQTIKQAYQKNINLLKNFQLLPHPVFDTARRQMLAQTEFFRDLKLAESRAIRERSVQILKNFQPQAKQCQALADKISPQEFQAAAQATHTYIEEAPKLSA